MRPVRAAVRTRSTKIPSSLVGAGNYLTLSQAAIADICNHLRAIEADIQQLRLMSRGPPVLTVPTCPLPSPLELMSDFDAFEEHLLIGDFRRATMAFLQTLGGETARDFVKRQMRSLFASTLLPGFNLNGRYSKRNFRHTNTFKMIQDVYRVWSAGRTLTLLDFEKAVRSVLKSAVTAASVRRLRQNYPE
ncbi:hypothetical protein AAHC03_019277 [Spirometra sp. Aus1]